MMMLRKTLIWWTLNPLYFVGHWCAKGIKTYKRYTMHKGIVSWCACVSHHRKALIVFEYTSMLLDSAHKYENHIIKMGTSNSRLFFQNSRERSKIFPHQAVCNWKQNVCSNSIVTNKLLKITT
uniref:Uncharacterized protein LOC8280413 n=1 Tax=Rhizophora mucronata TaxID=61149 RepID=A0A2P2M176_RHIMU